MAFAQDLSVITRCYWEYNNFLQLTCNRHLSKFIFTVYIVFLTFVRLIHVSKLYIKKLVQAASEQLLKNNKYINKCKK